MQIEPRSYNLDHTIFAESVAVEYWTTQDVTLIYLVLCLSQCMSIICAHLGPVIVGFEARSMTVAEDVGTTQIEVTLQQEVAVSVTVDITAVSGKAVEQQGQSVCIM